MHFPHLIAHRGASAYAPENTLQAFEKAKELGCRCVEFDVMLSGDGQAFIFHDHTLNRTTNARGSFSAAHSDFLATLDAGRWFAKRYSGERIPRFREVLHWLNDADIQANIEIKPNPGQMEQTVIAVLSELNHHWPLQKPLPLLSSFDLQALQLCRKLAPEMPLGLLIDVWQEDWQELAHDLQCVSVHLNWRALKKERVLAIKAQGYQVFAYTINRKRRAKKLFAWGVDAVFSDYPDLLS